MFTAMLRSVESHLNWRCINANLKLGTDKTCVYSNKNSQGLVQVRAPTHTRTHARTHAHTIHCPESILQNEAQLGVLDVHGYGQTSRQVFKVMTKCFEEWDEKQRLAMALVFSVNISGCIRFR